MFEGSDLISRSPHLGPFPRWPRIGDSQAPRLPLGHWVTGKRLPQRRVLLTSSQGSGQCLWEKDTRLGWLPCPRLSPRSWEPHCLPAHHYPPDRPHSRLTLIDTVFLVLMRLITSSWVQEEMEYPLIRTISSPTLATERNEYKVQEGQAVGQVCHQMPVACSPEKRLTTLSLRVNLDIRLVPCHNQPTLHQPAGSQARWHFQALPLPHFTYGETKARDEGHRVGSRARSRTQDSFPLLWCPFHSIGTPSASRVHQKGDPPSSTE